MVFRIFLSHDRDGHCRGHGGRTSGRTILPVDGRVFLAAAEDKLLWGWTGDYTDVLYVLEVLVAGLKQFCHKQEELHIAGAAERLCAVLPVYGRVYRR